MSSHVQFSYVLSSSIPLLVQVKVRELRLPSLADARAGWCEDGETLFVGAQLFADGEPLHMEAPMYAVLCCTITLA